MEEITLSTRSIWTLTRFIAPVAAAAAIIGGAATAAQASTPTPSPPYAGVAPQAGPSRLPAVFPSWWWGSTTVCIKNVGEEPGTALVLPVHGTFNVSPGEEKCRPAWVFGAPIVALNISTSHTELEGRTY
ncbi:hypothetical protein Lesp02_15680 [Lentzea sp. NBRC 105346]|uniref:hypothetical protein n=1 Tax=Lentzea sp. NBRC 105346 TaxID=3032205 RepID=UPI0024A2DBD7|nr:hypothetical protein [Lentzea sp. NBRC 105346]GLZ29378.1 hypothetical protein Lesp02_15680 [Lentzea sp. NBRC 105346]